MSTTGGQGDDVLDGGYGRDTIDCGPGTDTVIAGAGDTIIAREGVRPSIRAFARMSEC